MFGTLGGTLLLFLVIFQSKRILAFFNLAKVRMRASEGEPVLRTRGPGHTLHLLDNAKQALAGLGFELIGTQAYGPFNLFDPRSHTYTDFHWHPEKTVLAVVEPAGALSGQATRVDFVTMFADGTCLMTVNRRQWELLPLPEEITVVDALADDLAGQWAFHQEAVADEAKHRSMVTDKPRVMKRLPEILTPHALEHLAQIGWAEEESAGIYRLTARGAWRYSGQIRRVDKEVRGTLARPYKHVPTPDTRAVRVIEMNAVAANIELGAQPLPTWIKVVVFAVTLALSVLTLGNFSPLAAAALVLVMFVHELGHFTAMWALGYKNLSMFFLPFFGAAASGHKPHAPAWQEAIVLLAGPVPGIVLALAATQVPSEALPLAGAEFVRWFVLFGLIINLFNLLPVGVLDGGRLFQLAVLGRFPFARAAFATVGAFAGLIYALSMGSRGLAVAMVILLIGTPLQFKVARVTAAIRRKAKAAGLRKLSKEDVILALGEEFAHRDFGGTNAKDWTQRLGIAKLAYPRLLQGVPAVATSFVVVVAQGFALFAPVVLVVWSLQHGGEVPLLRTSQAEQQQLDREAAASPEAIAAQQARDEFMVRYNGEVDPSAKWAMLDQASNEDVDVEEAAPADLDPAWVKAQRAELAMQLPPEHPGRLRHILDVADTPGPEAAAAVQGVIAQLTENDPQKAAELDPGLFRLLLDAYAQLARVGTPEVLAGQAGMLDALWAGLDAPGNPNAAAKAELASVRARMAYAAGRQDDAAAWMERYVAAAGADDPGAALAQGWFLLDIGRHDEALNLATSAIGEAKPGAAASQRSGWETLAGWAEMARGRTREADGYFRAVLDETAMREQAIGDRLPWWLRWGYKAAGLMAPGELRVNGPTLDHLAALNGYDPEQGARVMADLTKSVRPGARQAALSEPVSPDGWGKARAAAHGRLLKAIYAGR